LATYKEYMDEGLENYNYDDFTAAIYNFGMAVSVGKNNEEIAEAYFYIGKVYHTSKNDIKQATEFFKKSADYGNKAALQILKAIGVDYTPRRSSSTPEKTKFTDKDGNSYEGYATYGTPNGKGKITYTDGDIYEGDWVDGIKHGKGKYTYADGDIFEGNFVDGNPHGIGKFTFADGNVEEVEWVDGKFKIKESINYTPQGSSSSDSGSSSSYSSSSYSGYSYDEPRNGFVSFLFGLIIGVGIALSAYWVYTMVSDETGGTVQVLVILGGLIAGIIITFLAWRNRKYILFFIMLALSIPGWYNVAIEILGLQNGIMSAARKTAARGSADIISTNAGWTTFVDGGNAAVKNGTSADLTFGKETIQNAETDVMTLTVNLASGTEWRIGEFTLDNNSFIQQLKSSNGIRFSVFGDGNDGWRVMFPMTETLSDNCYHETAFTTVNGSVTQVNIPFTRLAQPDWGNRVTFNKNNIVSIKIQRHSTERNLSGASTIKVFDFETY